MRALPLTCYEDPYKTGVTWRLIESSWLVVVAVAVLGDREIQGIWCVSASLKMKLIFNKRLQRKV